MGDEATTRSGSSVAEQNAVNQLDTNGMFAALLTQMNTMNQNFASFFSKDNEEIVSDNESTNQDQDDAGSENEQGDTADDALQQLIQSTAAAESDKPSVLEAIAADLNVSEKTDPAINQGLAEIFNTLVKSKMSEGKLKEKIEQYVRPENVKDLRVPKVNPLVWSQLSSSMRSQDSKSQISQGVLQASTIASMKAANLVMEKYSNDQELLKLVTDSVAMALQYNHDVNQSRRMALKKELHKDYASLCNVSPAEEGNSEFLFGDIAKATKDIAEANKLTKKVKPSNHGSMRGNHSGQRRFSGAKGNRRFQPYSRNKSGSFLDNSHPSKFKKKREGSNNQRQ